MRETLAPHGRPAVQGCRVRCRLPLYRRASTIVTLKGEAIQVTVQWLTQARWVRSPDSAAGSGWHGWQLGAFVVAIRVEG